METPDSQLVEVYGRNWLVSELLHVGWEVAFPVRDHGVDLIAYRDTDPGTGFQSVPIQLKSRSGEDFGIEAKYASFPNLLLVYVWNADASSPERTTAFALTYGEALQLAHDQGWTETASWREKGSYVQTKVSEPTRAALSRHKMNRERWPGLLDRIAQGPSARDPVTQGVSRGSHT